MTKRRTIMRDERAPLGSMPGTPIQTAICTVCGVENNSPDGSLPRGWRPIPGGVICAECPAGNGGRTHG